MPFKRGDQLRQKVHVAEGPVKKVQFDEDAGTFQYLIESLDPAGNIVEVWLDESNVEAAPAAQENPQ